MRDADVRAALRERLFREHDGDSATRIVEEMGIWAGAVRVDMAVINGRFWGYEIKSDNDTLERLPYQAEIYGKVFDRVTLVVGVKHFSKALDIIPDWWGCVVAKANKRHGGIALTPKRRARNNPSPDPDILVQLLWKEEAVSVLEQHGLADGWRSKLAGEIGARLISELPPRKLAEGVRDALRAREKLGQLVPSEFNMPIDAVADPSTRTAGRS